MKPNEFSHWNYRVLRKVQDVPNVGPCATFRIIEVYYGPDNASIEAYADFDGQGAIPYGDTLEELKGDIERMLAAFNYDIVEESDLPVDS